MEIVGDSSEEYSLSVRARDFRRPVSKDVFDNLLI